MNREEQIEYDPDIIIPSDAVQCRRCGKTISDAEHDDNRGYCEECAVEGE